MKKRWLRGLLLGVSLALLLGGGVAVAQDVRPSNGWNVGTMPAVPAGTYHTDIDNEDNAHSGNPDDDMGVGAGVNQCVYEEDSMHPIEFRISSPGGKATLTIAAWDIDEDTWEPGVPEEDSVYFNGAYLGNLVNGPNETWTLSSFSVVATGNDLIEVVQVGPRPEGGCFGIAWGALDIAEEEFVPEPGSILLLGSGLMGLAGYAGLRWRTRE